MSDIKWQHITKLDNKFAVEDFAEEHGVAEYIPTDFKRFFHSHNNGVPTPNIIITEDGKELEIETFLSFNEDDPDYVGDIIEDEDIDGSDLLPFAREDGESYFCLEFKINSTALFGKITVSIVIRTPNGNTYHICDTFTEFIKMLEEGNPVNEE